MKGENGESGRVNPSKLRAEDERSEQKIRLAPNGVLSSNLRRSLVNINPILNQQILGGTKMATATFLTMGLLFLLGLRQADKRQNRVDRRIQQYREYTTDGYLIDEL